MTGTKMIEVSHRFITTMIETVGYLWRSGNHVKALQLLEEMMTADAKNVIILEQYAEVLQHVLVNGLEDLMEELEIEDAINAKKYLLYHADNISRAFINMMDDKQALYTNDMSTQSLITLVAIDEQVQAYSMELVLELADVEQVRYMNYALDIKLMLLDIIAARVEEMNDEINNAF